MLDSIFGKGKLEKMKISRLENTATLPGPGGEEYPPEYFVQVNPESYNINYQINHDRRPAPGNSGSEANYSHHSPPTLAFDFLFDGTGVIPAPTPLDGVPLAGAVADLISGADEYDVMEEIRKFSHVVYDYSGDEHQPNEVQILWGTLEFHGVLDSLELNYKLFKPDGTPLRVEAKASFTGTVTDVLRTKLENKNSPDVTHLRTIRAEDRLPVMTHRIYGDPSYYLEVARANKLYNFRELRDGEELFFPPVEK